MKLKLKDILITSIILQIISTQGILVFKIFEFFGNWEVKSILHPISLILVIIYFLLKATKKIKITAIEIVFFCYLIFCFLILIFNTTSPSSILYSFREVFLLFILVFIYNQSDIPETDWEKILKMIYYFILINLFFVALTYYLGPKDYMEFLTGRYFWTHDPLYKFKISNFHQFWRSPGLVGSAGAMAYFALLAYFLFDNNAKYKKKKYFALVLICSCFVRSAFLALFIYILFKFLVKKKNLKRLALFVKFSIPLLLVLGVFLFKKNIFSINSVFMRVDNWFQNINVEYNLFFGGAIGELGAAARGEGFIATIDSYWIYMLLCSGLIGIMLILFFFYEKIHFSNNLKIICIALLFAGFFVSLTQSIPFLVLFPLFFLKHKEHQYLEYDKNTP